MSIDEQCSRWYETPADDDAITRVSVAVIR